MALFLNDFAMRFGYSVRVTQTGYELLIGFPDKLVVVDDCKPGA